MTRNPIESLMQRLVTRRDAGKISVAIATGVLSGAERPVSAETDPKPPQFERVWTDDDENKHFALLLQPGQAAVFTTQGALQAFGNVYSNPGGLITLLAMTNITHTELEIVVPGKQSVDTNLLVSAGNTYEERIDDVFRFIQEEHARLQAASARAEKPMKPLAVVGAIAIGRTVEGQITWNKVLQQAIDPEGNLSIVLNVPEARPGTLPKKAAPKGEAPTPVAEEEEMLPFIKRRPASLNAPDMGSIPLGQNPKKEYFHPIHNTALFNQENGWGGVWSWGVSLLDGSDNASFIPNKKSGEVTIEIDEGHKNATIRVGVMTAESNLNDYKKSQKTGQLYPVAMWIKTSPGARVRLFNPETGKPLMDEQGKPLVIITNHEGSAGVLLPDNGQLVAVWKVVKGDPVSTVSFGPHDEPDHNTNIIDARGAKAQ